MKKSTFTSMASCLLVLFMMGCEKGSLLDPAAEQKTAFNLKMNTINELGEGVASTIKVLPTDRFKQRLRIGANPNQIATGNFRTVLGSKYNLSAIMNAGGISGEWQINSANLGHVYLKSICVYVDGNVATMAGVVTEVERAGVLRLNYIVYLKVKDNGEGNNSPSDQSSSIILYYPDWFNFYPSTDAFLIDFPCEVVNQNPIFGAFIDQDGQIQVR